MENSPLTKNYYIGIKFQWVYKTSVTKILILDHDIPIR